MVNGEIGGGLYKAYGIIERWVAFQWVYSGSTVALQWLYSGSTVALQWVYSGSTTNKRRRNDEQKTNLRWR